MKIFHIIESLDPSTGGPGIIAASLAAAQASEGHDATIICSYNSRHLEDPHDQLEHIPNIKSVKIINTSSRAGIERIFPLQRISLFRKLITSATVLHLHGMWEPALYWASRIAIARGATYAVIPHSMLNPWELGHYSRIKKTLLHFGLHKMLANASFVHVGTKDEANFIVGLSASYNTEVIPNGVFIEQFEPLPSTKEFHILHPELQNKPYILFMGRLHQQKGLPYLADAFKIVAEQNNDVQLVVIGPDGGEQSAFESKIESYGISKRVHIMGPIYGREKIEAIRGAACSCHPSLNEGFSMSILEVLGCGVPAVISETCFFPEVEKFGAGKVTTLEPNSIAFALLEIISNDKIRDEMANNARALIEKIYNWPNMAQRVIDAYKTWKS